MKGNVPVDLTSVVPISEMEGDSEIDTALLRGMEVKSREYLEGFGWCRTISEGYFGLGIGGIIAVFLFRIVPNTEDVDEWLWVIIGDLPPAYLVTDISPNPVAAVRSYIHEMRKWISAVECGETTEDLIPVNAPGSREFASALSIRLSFLETELIVGNRRQN